MPQWVAEAKTYLAAVSQDKRWKEVVRSWEGLEALLRYPSRQVRREPSCSFSNGSVFTQGPESHLPTKNRPMQVRQWIQTHRQYEKIPTIRNVAQYGAEWELWWHALQPEMRLDEAGELQRPEALAEGDSWSVLRRGGPNGFFLVLLALSWWLASADEGQDMAEVWEMVEDVCWVLGKLLVEAEGIMSREEGSTEEQREGGEDGGDSVSGKGKKRVAGRSANAESPKRAKRG